MKYRKGYRIQIAEDEVFKTSFRPVKPIITKNIELYPDGKMIVKNGFACDGPTGTIRRKTNTRPATGHDAKYDLMRMGLLDWKLWPIADGDYAIDLREDGAWEITIKINIKVLKTMRGYFANPKRRKKIYKAP